MLSKHAGAAEIHLNPAFGRKTCYWRGFGSGDRESVASKNYGFSRKVGGASGFSGDRKRVYLVPVFWTERRSPPASSHGVVCLSTLGTGDEFAECG